VRPRRVVFSDEEEEEEFREAEMEIRKSSGGRVADSVTMF